MIQVFPDPPRSALYVPASKPRALVKAAALPVDLVIVDLEDAVAPADKDAARDALANLPGLAAMLAIRVNAADTGWHADDLAAVSASKAHYVVLPKVEDGVDCARVAALTGKPVLAMIETPRGVLRCADIAAAAQVAGLIAGTNDLAATLRLPFGERSGLQLSLQTIVLAARAQGIWALDGVFNGLSDATGFDAQCREGRMLGFDGKTLIHPDQVEPANAIFGPSEIELEDARALVSAAATGATRFRDRMVETLHVDAARRLIERAQR